MNKITDEWVDKSGQSATIDTGVVREVFLEPLVGGNKLLYSAQCAL